MPRDLRPQEAGLNYHVMSRGNRKGPIYQDDFDRYSFLGHLAKAVRIHNWVCHAYCLMTSHYHLLITTPEPNIARGMQLLNSRHAATFNRRYKLSGHLFQGRYHAVVVKQEAHLLELFRYIALNPVRAGLCLGPEDWAWSSYACALGLRPHPEFLSSDLLLDPFSFQPARARVLLHEFVVGRQDERLAA